MITPDHIQNNISSFQENDIGNDSDYRLLLQQKQLIEQKLVESNYYSKNLQLLYSLVEKSKNYQEFIDILMNNKNLLREIFTLGGQLKQKNKNLIIDSSNVCIDWYNKYGIDIMEYIINDEKLLALYNNGLL